MQKLNYIFYGIYLIYFYILNKILIFFKFLILKQQLYLITLVAQLRNVLLKKLETMDVLVRKNILVFLNINIDI